LTGLERGAALESVTSVRILAGNHEYDAIVDSGLLDRVGPLILEKARPGRCAIVSDTNISELFAVRLRRSLTTSGFQPTLITIPSGEQAKTFAQAGEICDQMIAAGLDRKSSFVVGLGGGVIGDISGFVAAIFQRGIPHVQIPTTLLAMVDSSIGGKTGVNTSAGKNLLGAVHHPLLVIDDVEVLQTLPDREFVQGFAEIIKHAIIADAEMFEQLNNTEARSPRRPPALQQLIKRNIEIKSRIVTRDELDRTGERALLNFGHTVGHAIERAGGYQTFLHGEAISLGMVAAANISVKRAGLPAKHRDAIVSLLRRFKLPTQLPSGFAREGMFQALPFDKKFESGKIRFVLTSKIGSAYLASDITMEDIQEAVEEL
jgi:3-dehydroquinate synthase